MPEEGGIQKLIDVFSEKGYTHLKMYAENTHVRFVLLRSTLQRREFIVIISQKWRTNAPNHTLDQIENNYLSFRQRDYLSKINLDRVACFSEKNICIKGEEDYTCYLLDTIPDEGPSATEPRDLPLSDDDEEEDDGDDIEIDDFSVGVILPVFLYEDFINSPENFEDIVAQHYDIIRSAEEEMNSSEVERIIDLFKGQEKLVKEKMFEIHKRAYHVRRDLTKYGKNLEKLLLLKEKSVGEKDLVRFKIDRLILETEEKIDELNGELMEGRNRADVMIKKYIKYIDTFTNL